MTIFELFTGALSGSQPAYQYAATQQGFIQALTILFTSGVALGLGQSVVLFANRVPARRFIVSLAAGALALVTLVILWSTALWALAALTQPPPPSLLSLLGVVSLSFAPLALGFFILLPYLGTPLFYLLLGWTLFNLLRVLEAVFGFTLWQALLALGIGGGLILILLRSGLLTWVWQKATGAPPPISPAVLASSVVVDLDPPINGNHRS